MAISDEKAAAIKELGKMSVDLIGLREVTSTYSTGLQSSDYNHFMIINRDDLQTVKGIIDTLIAKEASAELKANEEGERQYLLCINNVESNPVIYLDGTMKNATIDGFKGVLPNLDAAQEAAIEAKETEIDGL